MRSSFVITIKTSFQLVKPFLYPTLLYLCLTRYSMKVILDIQESKVPFFMELLNSLDYIRILKEVSDKEKGKAIEDLVEAFNDVKLYEEGKKELKSAKDLLDEL